jgi:uncharacterized membrane protein YkoI
VVSNKELRGVAMQASRILHLKPWLSPLAIVVVLASPCAFAKKDLFANDPGTKQIHQVEQFVPSTSSSTAAKELVKEQAVTEAVKGDEKTKISAPEPKSTTAVEPEKKSSYLETQFSRFKGHLVEAKEDLFGSNKKSTKKEALTVPQQTEPAVVDSVHSSEEAHPELPTISAAEAAQRAQSLAEGQVINVRKYQVDDKPRYAVKLLQKNGRMKTINLDAVSGTLIEEISQ